MPAQLSLEVDPTHDADTRRWSTLPAATREQLLVLLARLIAGELFAEDTP